MNKDYFWTKCEGCSYLWACNFVDIKTAEIVDVLDKKIITYVKYVNCPKDNSPVILRELTTKGDY